jgi:succinate dehydrogenase / fumarate reductase, cytochrome b subunit
MLTQYFTSSIGRKLTMGLTGLFLITFLLVHCGINACIFYNDGGETFNLAAHFMGSNIIIRTMELGLFAGLLLHIYQGLMLWRDNRSRRTVQYAVQPGNVTSTWYSRSMGLLGTLLLFFLIVHLAHFWVPSRITGLEEIMIDGKPHHNLFIRMVETFQSPFVVLIYVLGCLSLSYHLLHGFQSAFQTLGLNHKKYTPLIKFVGAAFAIVIPFVFALMPVALHFGWVN